MVNTMSSRAISKMERTLSCMALKMSLPPVRRAFCIASTSVATPDESMYGTLARSMIRRLGFFDWTAVNWVRRDGALLRSISPMGMTIVTSLITFICTSMRSVSGMLHLAAMGLPIGWVHGRFFPPASCVSLAGLPVMDSLVSVFLGWLLAG